MYRLPTETLFENQDHNRYLYCKISFTNTRKCILINDSAEIFKVSEILESSNPDLSLR